MVSMSMIRKEGTDQCQMQSHLPIPRPSPRMMVFAALGVMIMVYTLYTECDMINTREKVEAVQYFPPSHQYLGPTHNKSIATIAKSVVNTNPWMALIANTSFLRKATALPANAPYREPPPREFTKEPHTRLKNQRVLDDSGHVLYPELPSIRVDFDDVIRYSDFEENSHVPNVIKGQAVYRKALEIIRLSKRQE